MAPLVLSAEALLVREARTSSGLRDGVVVVEEDPWKTQPHLLVSMSWAGLIPAGGAMVRATGAGEISGLHHSRGPDSIQKKRRARAPPEARRIR